MHSVCQVGSERSFQRDKAKFLVIWQQISFKNCRITGHIMFAVVLNHPCCCHGNHECCPINQNWDVKPHNQVLRTCSQLSVHQAHCKRRKRILNVHPPNPYTPSPRTDTAFFLQQSVRSWSAHKSSAAAGRMGVCGFIVSHNSLICDYVGVEGGKRAKQKRLSSLDSTPLSAAAADRDAPIPPPTVGSLAVALVHE